MSLDHHAHPALAALALLMVSDMPPELEVLRRGLQSYMRHEGRLPLDRALGLPSPRQFVRQQRDHHVVEALGLVDKPSARARVIELRRLLIEQASTSWRRWRAAGGIPAYATPLQRAMFEILSRGPDTSRPTVPSPSTLRRCVKKTG